MIGVGGLLLAKVPEEIAKQRQDYMTNRHKDRSKAVENDLMKEQDSRMPINVERQSRVTFGGTKKVILNIISINNPYPTMEALRGRWIRRNNTMANRNTQGFGLNSCMRAGKHLLFKVKGSTISMLVNLTLFSMENR